MIQFNLFAFKDQNLSIISPVLFIDIQPMRTRNEAEWNCHSVNFSPSGNLSQATKQLFSFLFAMPTEGSSNTAFAYIICGQTAVMAEHSDSSAFPPQRICL